MEVLKLKQNKYGYTLLELILVLALFSIMLSLVMPSLSNIYNTKENKELMEFKRDIIFARNSAVVENCIYGVYIDLSNNSYKIVKEDKITTIIKDKQFTQGITIKSNNFKNSINFSATGTPNRSGTILVTNRKNQNIEITITPATGKVNLYNIE
ncbi:GspH/FimT family pseudopilin [Tissierella sp.]|uniref:GspH/FimT family pseudopilin n=1 Tax=Tissierella sp. TaxID=41274 RepID=UPI00286E48BB|nr:GspH/FimT family pseudopilin [Tissierella sp.]